MDFSFTKRSTLMVLSIVYLTALTVLAIYAFYQANYFSLPMAQTLPALAVALPPLAGIAYESVVTFHRRLGTHGMLQASAVFQTISAAFLVYEAVLATLAGTHVSSTTNPECRLRDQWQRMVTNKQAHGIRRIQDTFDCCGFKSSVDHPWPFKGGGITDKTCMERFARDTGCFEAWKGEERKVAIMLMIVPIGVFIWKVLVILAPKLNASWLPSAIRLTNEGPGNQDGRVRRVIEFGDAEERADDSSASAEVNQLNQEASFASHVEGSRVRASPLIENHDIDRWSRM